MSTALNQSGDEQLECPLCMEPFEVDDLNFYPCTCGYQICRFCWHRIRTDENGLCPACRKPYAENPADFTPLSLEQMNKMKAEKRLIHQLRKAKVSESRKHLSAVRVVQQNLVFVVGLPARLADAEVLKRHEYFGKFGKIHKVVINQCTTYAGSQGPSASAYVTYVKSDDALRAIQTVNNVTLDGRSVKCSLGTTKYCSHFMKNQPCPKAECMYLHELGDSEASFTKDQMHAGKHQEYERKLLDSMMQRQISNNGNGGVGGLVAGSLTSSLSVPSMATGSGDGESGGGGGGGGGVSTSKSSSWSHTDSNNKGGTKSGNNGGKGTSNSSGRSARNRGRSKGSTTLSTNAGGGGVGTGTTSGVITSSSSTGNSRSGSGKQLSGNRKQRTGRSQVETPPISTATATVQSIPTPPVSIQSSVEENVGGLRLVDDDNSSFFSSLPRFVRSASHRDGTAGGGGEGTTVATDHFNSYIESIIMGRCEQKEVHRERNGCGDQATLIEHTLSNGITALPSEKKCSYRNSINCLERVHEQEVNSDHAHDEVDDNREDDDNDGADEVDDEEEEQEDEDDLLGLPKLADEMPIIHTDEDWAAIFGFDGSRRMIPTLDELSSSASSSSSSSCSLLCDNDDFVTKRPPPATLSTNVESGHRSLLRSTPPPPFTFEMHPALTDATTLSSRQCSNNNGGSHAHTDSRDKTNAITDHLLFQRCRSTSDARNWNGDNNHHNHLNDLLRQHSVDSALAHDGRFAGDKLLLDDRGVAGRVNANICDGELDFDPFKETQKGFSELLADEYCPRTLNKGADKVSSLSHLNGIVHGSNDLPVASNPPGLLRSIENGLREVSLRDGITPPPPPPGFMQANSNNTADVPSSSNSIHTIGSKILPFLNMTQPSAADSCITPTCTAPTTPTVNSHILGLAHSNSDSTLSMNNNNLSWLLSNAIGDVTASNPHKNGITGENGRVSTIQSNNCDWKDFDSAIVTSSRHFSLANDLIGSSGGSGLPLTRHDQQQYQQQQQQQQQHLLLLANQQQQQQQLQQQQQQQMLLHSGYAGTGGGASSSSILNGIRHLPPSSSNNAHMAQPPPPPPPTSANVNQNHGIHNNHHYAPQQPPLLSLSASLQQLYGAAHYLNQGANAVGNNSGGGSSTMAAAMAQYCVQQQQPHQHQRHHTQPHAGYHNAGAYHHHHHHHYHHLPGGGASIGGGAGNTHYPGPNGSAVHMPSQNGGGGQSLHLNNLWYPGVSSPPGFRSTNGMAHMPQQPTVTPATASTAILTAPNKTTQQEC